MASSDKTLSDLLSVPFNPTIEWDISSLETIGISVKGADRAALKISNPKAYYDKVREIACASIKDKFSLMKVINQKSLVKDFVQSIYSIDIQL